MPRRWALNAVESLRRSQQLDPEFRAYFSDAPFASGPLGALFQRLSLDAEGRAFVERCERSKGGLFFVQRCAFLALQLVGYSRTDALGFAGLGDMFVLSSSQLFSLLGPCPAGAALLDVGAGSGAVTAAIARWAQSRAGALRATEASAAMRRRLRRRGIAAFEPSCLGAPDFATGPGHDLIFCFNVLDRCSHPKDLLREMTAALAPGGRLVVAVVVPFCPFVEEGWHETEPAQRWRSLEGRADLAAVAAEFRRVFAAAGLGVARLTRVPYLCQSSDWLEAVAVLENIVFVLEKEEKIS